MGNTIKLNGADYKVVDTQDGYKTVKDMPIFSEIPKGTHGAPYDVTKQELEKFLSTMQSRYTQGKRCGALSVGHNDDLGLTHPDFAGFFLPTKVAQYKFPDGKDRWTLYADAKISNDKFELFQAGKLHSHSPEIYAKSWDDRKIDVLSFLDTKPPYFDYAMNTVGEVTKDPTAKFEAVYEERDMTLDELKKKLLDGSVEELLGKEDAGKFAAKFAAYTEKEKPPADPAKEDKFAKDYPEAHKAMAKLMSHFNLKFDTVAAKPDALPIETSTNAGGTKMELDPVAAARFAAQDNKIAEMSAALAAQESEKKAKGLVEKADAALSKKVVTTALHAQIATFASDAAVRKDGEAWFDKFVESLKPSLRDKPPSTVAEFQAVGAPSVDSADPVFSKFTGEDPTKIAKFSSDYRRLKKHVGDNMKCTEEAYIKNELVQLKAKLDGELVSETGR